MTAYEYYRSSVPNWGTSQFQFASPPMPAFQPQPTWTGYDFYNAHAINPDPTLYNHVMGQMGSYSRLGVDHRTARHWHNMIYSGMMPLTQVLPADIGAAAAYEVYRTWKYNSSLHAPLSADRMMQREGLIGMAIAEATRLWQYTGRSMDAYGQRAACEAAGATAALLADRFASMLGGGTTVFPSSPVPSPYLSPASLPGSYSPSGYSIPAPAGSTVVLTRPRHRSHSRGHSHSRDRHGHHHRDYHGHHHGHHHHRSNSVDIIQTGGGGYGYQPYTAGYGGGGYGGGYGYGAGAGTVPVGYGGYGGQYSAPSGCVIC
ncbi:hypothetical protein C8Q80DRAFT_1222841 [Daedaleopsis nitida]|nr:hypothetical protein C8Q80DRAFT_1222841 [Daedaleopsis nitida]